MATLAERHALSIDPDHLKKTKVTLAKACVDVLLLPLSGAATDAAKKELRVKQRWAERTLANPNPVVAKVALMLAAAATDAVLVDGITDVEYGTLVGIAINVLSAVELHAPTEVLPA